jgi:uncharacterized protein YjbJ (UPF0337 family)
MRFGAPRTGIRAQTTSDKRRDTVGLMDKLKGKAKEVEGKATGDKQREAEGKLEQAKGDAKDAVEHVRDAAGNLVERARDEAEAGRAERAAAEDRR